ncbi:MAG: HEAT repeat domain-containing protein [Pseudomonadota bacterium]
MNRIIGSIVTATLLTSPYVLAQETPSAADGSEQSGEYALDPAAVVVFPVEARSSSRNYTQLAEVVHNEFLAQLKKIQGIHVIDPGLVKPYSRSSLDNKDVARQLGAATMLESSVVASPPAYEVRYAFISIQSGKHHISGSMRSFEKWEPGHSLSERILEGIAESMTSVEWGIFPDRRSAGDYEQTKAKARARFLNGSLSAKDRLAALRTLTPPIRLGYPRQYADGGVSLTGEVAIAAAQLALESDDPKVRMRVWLTMVGVDDRYLVDPLIHALAHDVDARVRSRAATALAVHKHAPGVREALENAREHDPSRSVRSSAQLAAATAEEQKAILRSTVMDTSYPESERRAALYSLWTINRKERFVIDDELAGSMIKLANTSSSRPTQRLVWVSLGEMGGATVVQPLIETLHSETDETMREVLVEALSNLIDQQEVRDTLRNVQSDDHSPLVRAAAQCALRGGGWC